MHIRPRAFERDQLEMDDSKMSRAVSGGRGEFDLSREVDLELKPIEVAHPHIRAVIFVTVVEDPVDDWADIWVDLRDGRRYSFTIFTPSMIVRNMREGGLASHMDHDQLIVRELTVSCIVDGVNKMLRMECIDRMGILHGESTSVRSKKRRSSIREIEWDEGSPPDAGARITVRLADGRRYGFAPLTIASIADELRKPSRLSFVKEGLLVVREVSDDCVRKGVEEIIKNGLLERHGVRLDRKTK
ncbi:MAG: hypothetical protein A2148_00955 [Chloroflexi bacterium RBG_16_68_14]|nr:MAG: hypothetical protein A2148_00955 [Chloroflexi bacterium RBG_16_68_14]